MPLKQTKHHKTQQDTTRNTKNIKNKQQAAVALSALGLQVAFPVRDELDGASALQSSWRKCVAFLGRPEEATRLTHQHWQSLAVTGSHWQSLAVTGSHWQSLAVTGSHWQSLPSGAWTWQHVALSDSHQALWLQPHNFVSAEGTPGEGSLLICSFRSDSLHQFTVERWLRKQCYCPSINLSIHIIQIWHSLVTCSFHKYNKPVFWI